MRKRSKSDYDFTGWATKNGVLCSDGRTIRQNAFKGNDGMRVPLVWNHQHNDPYNVMGHVDLENRAEGVYVYGSFNNTDAGDIGRELLHNGDVNALSIYANQLKQVGGDVVHGVIREVSLVIGGANPQALIDTVMSHGDGTDESAIISFIDESGVTIVHSDEADEEVVEETEEPEAPEAPKAPEITDSEPMNEEEPISHADTKEPKPKETAPNDSEKTIQDVIDTMNDEQKAVLYGLVYEVSKEKEDDEGDEQKMKHNAFEGGEAVDNEQILSHAEMQEIMADARKGGRLSDAFIAHGIDIDDLQYIAHDGAATYGIDHIDYLFPEARTLNPTPEFIKRDTGWVSDLINSCHKSPFSRIKSMFADLREDEARARGYMKGKLKKEEVFTLLKRTTDPQTVYKKQKLDRDDVIDIVDIDTVAWVKGEMRMMLLEEIARAILVGDGRLASSEDKIQENHIRPVWKDEALYNTVLTVDGSITDDNARAKALIRTVIKGRKNYKGSGNPTMYTTEDVLSDLLLLEDGDGKYIYDSVDKLATVLRVSKIVTVPVMEDVKDGDGNTLLAIIFNPKDYNIGADKGGATAMFEDFDIDYNQMKYLIETRCSGALVKPFSALTVKQAKGTTEVSG